ncbi:MAG: oligosaccharide flippase family protein [Chloroflexi bacterium]|nr:oligosaccharide flippase family protein [Chloroflexota bacterium]
MSVAVKDSPPKRLFRVLAGDVVLYGGGVGLSRGVQVLLLPVLARVLAPSEYAAIDLLTLLVSLGSVAATLGVDSGVVRFWSDSDDAQERQRVVSSGFAVILLATIVVTGALWLSRGWTAHLLFGEAQHLGAMTLAIWSIPALVVLQFCQSLLRRSFQRVGFLILSFGSAVAYIGLALLLVLRLDQGIEGVFRAQLLSYTAFAGLGLVFITRWLRPTLSSPLIKAMVLFGYPFLLSYLLTFALNYTDRLFLLRFTDLEAIGQYGVGSRVASVSRLAVSGFAMAWPPLAYQIHQQQFAKVAFARLLTYYLLLGGLLWAFFTIFAPELVRLLASLSFIPAARVIGLLTGTAVLSGLYYYFSVNLSIPKKTIYLALAVALGVAVNVGLDFLLVPRYGFLGAAGATFAGTLAMVAAAYWFSQRHFPLPFQHRTVVALVALSSGAGLVGSAVAWTVPSYPLSLGLRLALFLMASGAALAVALGPRFAVLALAKVWRRRLIARPESELGASDARRNPE